MKKSNLFKILFSLVIISIMITSCTQEENTETEIATENVDMEKIKSEIQGYENEWAKMVNTKNLEGMMAMYTEDAIRMGDNEPMVKGKEAIRTHEAKNMSESKTTMSFETLEVYGNEDTVTEIGVSTGKDATGTQVSSGKYMVIFKKVDGKYLCLREIYNGDAVRK